MAGSMEERIVEVRKAYEDLNVQAREDIPAKYRPFLMRLDHQETVRFGDEASTITVERPYFNVAGRVKWCRDEHENKGRTVDFATEFVSVAVGGVQHPVCRVTVESQIRGRAVGHAKVPQGSTGAELTNPLETAETSALGRALGFLGYGLVGQGVASYEEVANAKSEQAALRGGASRSGQEAGGGKSQDGGTKGKGSGPQKEPPATPSQVRAIEGRYSRAGVTDKQAMCADACAKIGIAGPIVSIAMLTKKQASALLDVLGNKK